MMKQEVRTLALARRNALSEEEIQEHSKLICASLENLLKTSTGIYLPYGSEVDITALLDHKEITFAIPKTFADHTIRFYRIHEETHMMKSKYGIWEPVDGVEVVSLDVIIVPLVAFDKNCNRLGHGGGYYDRFLEDFSGLRIGVAHECQRVESVYPQLHDVPLDYIVTEHQLYKRTDEKRSLTF